MRPDRETSAEIFERGLPVSGSGSTSNPKDPALAKGHVVEIFKVRHRRQSSMIVAIVALLQIMINFLQVTASAAIINANWTTWMRSLLSTAGKRSRIDRSITIAFLDRFLE